MEVVVALRLLWRRRLRVVLGAVLALAIGLGLGRSPLPSSGLATTHVVVDTARSDLVTDAPLGAETLGWRATLLAMLLGTDSARRQIAHELGITPSLIAVSDLELTAPAAPASLPTAAIQSATTTPEPYVLTVHTDDVLPIVWIQATAPDSAGAARLAGAAVHALRADVSPQQTARTQGLRIVQVSSVDAHEIPGGAGLSKAAVMAAAVFVIWCLALMIGPALGGSRRGFPDAGTLRARVRRAPQDRPVRAR